MHTQEKIIKDPLAQVHPSSAGVALCPRPVFHPEGFQVKTENPSDDKLAHSAGRKSVSVFQMFRSD